MTQEFKYFFISFELVGEIKKTFTLKADSYDVVVTRIENSKNGWFRVNGDLIHLQNVLTVNIQEIDLSSYDYKDEDFVYIK